MSRTAALLLGLTCMVSATHAGAATVPRAYELTLAPDVEHATFSGEEIVQVELDTPTRQIRLDAVELVVTEASVLVEGGRRRLRVRNDGRTLLLLSDVALPKGAVSLQLRWHGKLSSTTLGLYAVTTEGRPYVFTQLEPDGARGVFPCFDAPAMRARFVVHAIVDRGVQAVSSGPITTRLPEGDGRHDIVTFAPTPPLPTYLLSLAVGEFDEVEGRAGTVPVRVLAPPGKHEAALRALDTTVELLSAFERYLGVPFPFAKLDVVAVPHLGPHAMENAGAIFVRADELLGDDGAHRPSRRLAHELAHQWFGDLVTMAAWNDLWLSEGIARWAEFEILDEMHASWSVRDQFRVLRDHAIDLDGHPGIHAIRPPLLGDRHAAFDPITYDKGAATLRMLQVWMGDEAFRAALKRYLTKRAYGAASSEDFWAALGGPQIAAMARSWCERRGHPRVLVEVHCQHGAADVHLRQDTAVGEAPWAVPLVLHTPTTTMHLVLHHASAVLRLREPTGCPSSVEIEDAEELPFAVVHNASLGRAATRR